jgi:protoheme IX farnesyltransferase
MTESVLSRSRATDKLQAYLRLAKPRVVTLIVFCAVIGMFLATPGVVPLQALAAGTLGIALVAGAAAAANCLIEREIDAVMARTRGRPLPRGEVGALETLGVAGLAGGAGLSLLYAYTNPLTMWLTLATFAGYAVVYTVILKPRTPQNIVIGGASGAMPPVLGWAAVTGETPGEAWLLFLIIFVWTPPHFWSLALYRAREYADASLPMLPVARGRRYTQASILAYTLALAAVTAVPWLIGMSGGLYLAAAAALNARFIALAWQVWRHDSDRAARRAFRFSIVYLAALFAALLVDHYASARTGPPRAQPSAAYCIVSFTRSVSDLAWSFSITLARWNSTVFALSPSAFATALLGIPSTTRSSTSRSRAVRPPNSVRSCSRWLSRSRCAASWAIARWIRSSRSWSLNGFSTKSKAPAWTARTAICTSPCPVMKRIGRW